MLKLQPLQGDGGPAGPAPSWQITLPDGRVVLWQGFYTGPVVLPQTEVWDICRRLLGFDKSQVGAAARRELRPYAAAGKADQAIILYSATPLKKCFEADLDCVLRDEPADDPAAYIETRSVYLANPGDLVVGRTSTWKAAAAASALDAVEVPGLEYYYLTHALLKLADAHDRHPSPALRRIVDQLRNNPRSVVRVYALDDETQVLLLWLRRVAGIDQVLVDANGPEVADRWNQKAPLHPAVRDALTVPAGSAAGGPAALLESESELTPFCRELGLRLPRLPGYTIQRTGADAESVVEQITLAARLLTDRYGLREGCFKPARAGTGARIRLRVPLHDPASHERLAREAMGTDEDYVLEAHADYLRHKVSGHEFILAPSAHIRGGEVAEGATLQIMRGTVWRGNVFIDERTSTEFGITVGMYSSIREQMDKFLDAFQGGGRDIGLVKGGIDFAIARVGGRFGDDVLFGIQDLNLSSYGAEYMRVFLDEARAVLGKGMGSSPEPVYVATKVIRPTLDGAASRLQAMTDKLASMYYSRTITSVPGRFGLIAVASAGPVHAAEEVLQLEQRLRGAGLA